MGLIRFYSLILREAFRHSLDIAQAIIFVALAVGGFIAAYIPASKPMIAAIDLGGWKIVAIVFGSIILIRLILAPYWLWAAAERQNTADDKAETDRRLKKDLRVRLANFMDQGSLLMQRTITSPDPVTTISEEANRWAENAERFLTESLDDSYISRFRDGSNLPMSSLFIDPQLGDERERRSLWTGLRVRVARLQEFIKEQS